MPGPVAQRRQFQGLRPVVEGSVVVRTDTNDVVRRIRPVVRLSQRPDVVCLRVAGAVGKNQRVAAHLAFAIVKRFDAPAEIGVADDARGGGKDPGWRFVKIAGELDGQRKGKRDRGSKRLSRFSGGGRGLFVGQVVGGMSLRKATRVPLREATTPACVSMNR